MIEENFNGATFRLVTEDDMQPVSLNDPIENFRGEPDVLRNATCPRHGASSGHVNGYYAHVYGLNGLRYLTTMWNLWMSMKIMKLVYNGKKWVLYGDNGKVIVITRIRSICERYINGNKRN
tara:strand:+ start:2006 stop:2368 length:363 start_codon:yes stop_codon:yes gene_type:complete